MYLIYACNINIKVWVLYVLISNLSYKKNFKLK